MPRLGVDPEYRLGEELNLPSGLRSRSRSPHSYVGYISKEEQEWQDHQLAMRLQEEADRENLALAEDTLAPDQIAAILGTSFDIPSRRHEQEQNDDNDITILSAGSSPSSVTSSNSPPPTLSRSEEEMYDGELTLVTEHNEEDDIDGSDGSGDVSNSEEDDEESDDNLVEEQSDDDSGEEEMHGSEDDAISESDDSDGSEQSESSDSESSDSSDDEDPLGLGIIGIDLSLSDLEQVFESHQREAPRESHQDSDEDDEPDDTVIRSGDYGRCTICFEEVPYDPVGCLYCQQLIGCRRCVNRWYKAARRADDVQVDFLGGHPPSNHKQCPLCRHEWPEQVEATSIFLLKDD
ncbi:hypothetical protein RB195_013302 [Necator americanus]|uniref:RING-type domain-containing protein n=1 Tax=Necator americanus TaxID=51031 RepID=A0ABR1DUY5_NECAM